MIVIFLSLPLLSFYHSRMSFATAFYFPVHGNFPKLSAEDFQEICAFAESFEKFAESFREIFLAVSFGLCYNGIASERKI